MIDQRRFMDRARLGIQSALLKRDNLLIFTVASIDDINKTANLLFERMSEWYGVYFPELKLAEPQKFCEFVLVFDKSSPDEAALRAIVGDRAPEFVQKAKTSVGIKLAESDLDEIKRIASQILEMYKLRDELELYQQGLVSELAPNISYLCEPALAAKLIAASGGLDRLGLMPASTIQVLGAEKALFKHLRSGSNPPKHGVLFQHAFISASPKWARGKIARALATKIAIAVKADVYTKNFIAEKLKATFEARAKSVLAQKPPLPKPQSAQPSMGPRNYSSGRREQGGYGQERQGSQQGGRFGSGGGFRKGQAFKKRW